jgi:two-component sensor histidine kinase
MAKREGHYAAQYRVGMTFAVCSLAIALVNAFNGLVVLGLSPIEMLVKPAVGVLIANGVLFSVTCLRDSVALRWFQVLLIVANALLVKALTGPSDLTSVLFMAYSVLAAVKYDLLWGHLMVKGIVFYVVFAGVAVAVNLTMHDRPAALSIPYLVVTAFALYLYWTLFVEELRTSREQREALSRQVASRTKELTESNRRLETALEQKSELVRELHHRVRNNLAIMDSIANLQLDRFSEAPPLETFRAMKSRIAALSLVHTTGTREETVTHTDCRVFVAELVGHHRRLFPSDADVHVVQDVAPIQLPAAQAQYCGLILGECLSNALRHAFVGRRRGTVSVEARFTESGDLLVAVSDDGVGIPDAVFEDPGSHLGLWLIQTLAEQQLRGQASLTRDGGTRWTVAFPVDPAKQAGTTRESSTDLP